MEALNPGEIQQKILTVAGYMSEVLVARQNAHGLSAEALELVEELEGQIVPLKARASHAISNFGGEENPSWTRVMIDSGGYDLPADEYLIVCRSPWERQAVYLARPSEKSRRMYEAGISTLLPVTTEEIAETRANAARLKALLPNRS